MIKKPLFILFLITTIGYGLFLVYSKDTHIKWGHHFSFENELGMDVDSLTITIGNVRTEIQVGKDRLRTLEGNVNVPENGYPHEVSIIVYSSGKEIALKADSFNCFNCDGSHAYMLSESGAKYKFHN